MAPASASEPGRGGLALIVSSGDVERVHFALVLASAAAAIGRPVVLFFTLGALEVLARPAEDGTPGWRAMTTADGRTAGALDDGYAEAGVATFEELIGACVNLDVRVIVCEMGLRARGLSPAELRGDVPMEVGGVVTLLASLPEGAHIVHV
jgi:peroxiredoxin family protein